MAEGIGLFTLSLAWNDEGGKLQLSTGGEWGNATRLYHALKAATDKALEAVIEQKVQERTAQKEECPQ